MSEPTQPPIPDDATTYEIPGWDRPTWAVRGVKDGPELIWQREASVDVTYSDGGLEDTFAPELVRTDQVTIGEALSGDSPSAVRSTVKYDELEVGDEKDRMIDSVASSSPTRRGPGTVPVARSTP